MENNKTITPIKWSQSLMRGDLLTKSADDRNLIWKILVFGKKVAYGR